MFVHFVHGEGVSRRFATPAWRSRFILYRSHSMSSCAMQRDWGWETGKPQSTKKQNVCEYMAVFFRQISPQLNWLMLGLWPTVCIGSGTPIGRGTPTQPICWGRSLLLTVWINLSMEGNNS